MLYGYDHGAWMFGGWLGMLLMWLVPIILILAAIKYLASGSKSEGSGKTPLEILEAAYARGEIGRDEFLQKRDDLKQKQVQRHQD
jgi:putative membrane protein